MKLWIVLVPALAACGTDITGEWEGSIDNDESIYLDIEQDGEEVTGEQCETRGRDCMTLKKGTFKDDTLTYRVEFVEGGVTQRVEADLVLRDDDTLRGSGYSSKCDCTFEIDLERL